jgi:hypothetical protein
MPPTIEQHVEWISDCISNMKAKGLNCVETSETASEAWQKEVDRAAQATLLPKVKHSWYLGARQATGVYALRGRLCPLPQHLRQGGQRGIHRLSNELNSSLYVEPLLWLKIVLFL